MKETSKPDIYKLNTCISILLFAIIAFLWLLIFNRYHIIGFKEESQLFRTDHFYFQGYMMYPGGLTEYLGSFFTQFYYYPWLGAAILSLSITLVYILFMKICRMCNSNIDRFFIIPFTIPVLLLISCADFYFRLSYILGIIVVFSAFWLYLILHGRNKYIGGIILYILVYFVAGGNAIIFAALMVINELFSKNRSFLYITGMIALAVIVPYLSYLYIYIIPLQSAYLSVTLFPITLHDKAYNIVWGSIPVIYLLSWLIAKKTWLEKVKPLKVLIPYYLIICCSFFWGIKAVTNSDTEKIAHMANELERGNWEKVLDIRAGYTTNTNNILATYYTNIALSELGLLSSKMFHYTQTGTAGLFVNWAPTYFTPWYNGELYYRMGIIPEAEHSAYEAMVNSRKEHSSKTLRRLVYTTMLRKDSAGFEKYVKLFDNSPIYKKWAKQQREYYAISQSDTTYQIPGTPKPAKYSDFYINYDTPEYNLILLLRTDKQNKKAFEYLMASVMLQKDLKTMISVLEKYYQGMPYDKIPRHYEEALLICRYALKDREDVLSKYPVSQETIIAFNEYSKISEQANHQQAIDNLKKQYGNTYWYYYQYVSPILLEQAKAPNRY